MMAINQVIYGGETLMDVTDSTVTEENLVEGAVAYNAAGERIVGALNPFKGKTDLSKEIPVMGENLLLGSEAWTSAGWTGSAANGWTHTSGNTSVLSVPVSGIGEGLYAIEFDANAAIASNALTVTLGDSNAFDIYWGDLSLHYVIGVKVTSGNVLAFTPASNYTGKISNITVKRVEEASAAFFDVTDSSGAISQEYRPTTESRESLYLGKGAGQFDLHGIGSVGIGYNALSKNVSGFYNVAVGRLALRDNVGGSRNVAIGQSALLNNICGNRNIAIGNFALMANTTGNYNVSIGADSMRKNTAGSNNVAISFEALANCTTGGKNVAIGYCAARSLTTGNNNNAIGNNSLYYTTTGMNNFALGANSLYKNTTGSNNIAIGNLAGRGGANGAYAQNIFIGNNAAVNITGGCAKNVVIGDNAAAGLQDADNCIVIGAVCNIPNTNYSLNIGDLLKGSMRPADKYLEVDGGMQINALPTADPVIAGRLWNDNGIVKVSAG